MNRIRQLREKKELTQRKFVTEFNSYLVSDKNKYKDERGVKPVTFGTASRWENDLNQPTESMWNALANFFDVSVPYLKGYMVCTRCQGYFIPENDVIREQIECCPYCMNPYFEGDK